MKFYTIFGDTLKVQDVFDSVYYDCKICTISKLLVAFLTFICVLECLFQLENSWHKEMSPLQHLCRTFCTSPFPTVGNRTRRRTGGIQQKIIQYARDCLYSV